MSSHYGANCTRLGTKNGANFGFSAGFVLEELRRNRCSKGSIGDKATSCGKVSGMSVFY